MLNTERKKEKKVGVEMTRHLSKYSDLTKHDVNQRERKRENRAEKEKRKPITRVESSVQ